MRPGLQLILCMLDSSAMFSLNYLQWGTKDIMISNLSLINDKLELQIYPDLATRMISCCEDQPSAAEVLRGAK